MADIKNVNLDGTLYNYKDEKARNDISDLKEDISDSNGNTIFSEDLKNGLDKTLHTLFGEMPQTYVRGQYFENGITSSSTRVINSAPIPAGTYTIQVNDSSYDFWVFKYISDNEGVQIYGKRNSSIVVTSTSPIMLTVQRHDVANITPSEVVHVFTIIKANSTLADILNAEINSVNDNLSDSVETLNLEVFGSTLLNINLETDKTYNENGYAASIGMSCVRPRLSAGMYDIASDLGANYQYAIWRYNSDSSGEVFQSYGTTSRVSLYLPQTCVITIRKLDGVSFSNSDVEEVKSKFHITQHAAIENVVKFAYNYTPQKYSEETEMQGIAPATGLLSASPNVLVNGEDTYYARNLNGTLLDIRYTVTSAITPTGISEIDVPVYIPDATKISSITLYAQGTSFYRTASFTSGWNVLRFYTFNGDLTTWSSCTGFRFVISGTEGLGLYLGKVYLVRPPKGRIILVDDGAYKTFYTAAYNDLKNNNIPVTWALSPKRIIDGDALIISSSDLDAIAYDACSEFSYHSWNSEPTSTMTVKELQQDTAKCLCYLRKNGLLSKYFWRAATTQNTSPNYMSLIGFVEAIATGTNASGATTFPFPDKNNVPRSLLHGRSTSQIDDIFTLLVKSHCTYVLYTHGVDNDDSHNMTPEMWEYFFEKLVDCIGDGDIECTTFNRLMMEYE